MALLTEATPHLERLAPYDLGIVGNILGATRPAVRRKDPGNEIFLFGDPEVHHRFGAECACSPAPDIFALGPSAGQVGRMFELARQRKMVGPGLGTLSELGIPAECGNASERAFAIVAVEQAAVQAGEARLRAGQQHGGCHEQG